ncbi:MAG TPA: type II toxin-antitoxin system VapC family toxin [Solirubrobacterales bacterium]|nr:type II toxin-antitoxin system VapC family toxin [Solirubrobacterales bacterium]
MILDTSAVVAVIRKEQDEARFVEAIEGAAIVGIGTPTLVEASLVLVRHMGVAGRLALARFLEENDVVTIPFDEDHWSVAAEADIRYGKSRHPAALNYGDCMTYATARVAEHPLLFTGKDFAKTDLSRSS